MLFKSKLKANALLSVCPSEDGVAVACVQRANGAPPSLDLCTYAELDPAESQDIVLNKLVKAHSLERYNCTSIMALGSYNLLLVEAPDVPPAELRAAMRWRVKDLIDFHVDDAVIDVFEIADQRASGGNHLMYAVVARAALVKEQIDSLLAEDLKLSVVDIPELALRNIAALLPEDTSGVGLLHLVDGGGLITVTHQGTLYLSRLIDTTRNAAAAAAATDAREPETQEWLDAIVIEMQRSMDYYESHFRQPPIPNLVLAPMRNPIAGINDYLEAQLGIAVRRLDLNSLIDAAEPLSEELQFRCLLAIGAALRVEGKAL